MATPTPGKHGGHVAATPPVSTPFSGSQHLAFSPHGPKSVVPSPQQFKKSPANSNTVYGHPTNSSFGAMNFDSPSTAAALGIMPGLADLALDAAGGSLSALGRGDDDEKKRKLQQVIDILKLKKGRVSEEGIERLARRVGLECLWDDTMGSGGAIRTLIIAGTGLSLDIDFTNNVVGKVSVSFPESPEIVTKHANDASQILLRDLQLKPHESPLTKMLDKFALNLERLAALDKLSVMPHLNCHEAVAGIYESLKRLHEWELSRLKEEDNMKNKSSEAIVTAALCTKSGRPLMNSRGNVGLSLDYWQEWPRVCKTKSTETPKPRNAAEPKIWSVIVECAPSSALSYPPVRVTDKWISMDIRKANPTPEDLLMATEGLVLDWQDPESVLLPASDSAKGGGAMEGIIQDMNTNPDVKFVAKFNPPLVVPLGVAGQIYSATGATMDAFHLSTYDGLLFPIGPNEKHELDAAHRRIQRQQSVTVPSKDGQQRQETHLNTLNVQKLEYGHIMTELPFSHPRQLVDLLPIFRQYARLSSLLDRSFGSGADDTAPDPESSETTTFAPDEYADFMAGVLSSTTEPIKPVKLLVDVSLLTHPHPHLRITFPLGSRLADISLDVIMNGTVTITSQNVLKNFDAAANEKKTPTVTDLGRMLEIAEDLGVFVEFIRDRLQPQTN